MIELGKIGTSLTAAAQGAVEIAATSGPSFDFSSFSPISAVEAPVLDDFVPPTSLAEFTVESSFAMPTLAAEAPANGSFLDLLSAPTYEPTTDLNFDSTADLSGPWMDLVRVEEPLIEATQPEVLSQEPVGHVSSIKGQESLIQNVILRPQVEESPTNVGKVETDIKSEILHFVQDDNGKPAPRIHAEVMPQIVTRADTRLAQNVARDLRVIGFPEAHIREITGVDLQTEVETMVDQQVETAAAASMEEVELIETEVEEAEQTRRTIEIIEQRNSYQVDERAAERRKMRASNALEILLQKQEKVTGSQIAALMPDQQDDDQKVKSAIVGKFQRDHS